MEKDKLKMKAGFVGFGEVFSPRELIEKLCGEAQQALEARGIELVATAPVSDDAEGVDEARGIAELSREDFDFLVVCLAGWIPSQTVINTISPFAHKPMVLWGLTGYMDNGRLVTAAAQAGTTALRDPMEGLGFRFKYVYDSIDAASSAADKILDFARVARTMRLLRQAKIGFMGYRDMHLYATLVDGVSLRRVVGPEIEVFEMLETVQAMESLPDSEVAAVVDELRSEWAFEEPVGDAALQKGVRLYLALMRKVHERNYEAISVVDVYGVKKLLHFPPAMALMLLADKGGVASIPENDGLGAVTQLIVRYLTGQVGAYLEFYEFMTGSLLMGVPDYVPSEIVEGDVTVRPWPGFGGLGDGILNVSKPKTGRATICRLGSRGDRYRMHILTGEAVPARSWEEAGWEPPAPQLPSLEFVPDGTVDDFAQKVMGQHYIIAYGDHREQLTDLCKMLGIEVI